MPTKPTSSSGKRKPTDEQTNQQQPAPQRPADPPLAADHQAAPATVQTASESQAVKDPGDWIEAEKMATLVAVTAILRRPFRADQLGWKAQAVSQDKTKCLAVPFIDARDVMNRLDEAVGIARWRDGYFTMPDGSVVCRLELNLGGEWIAKEDVGGQSDQPDEGDRAKAAHSDALKRAAVKWGIARYLYALPTYWVAYDEKKRGPVQPPPLPPWALPPREEGKPPAPAAAAAAEQHQQQQTKVEQPAPAAAAPGPDAKQQQQSAQQQKADFVGGLHAYDATLTRKGLCKAGGLIKYVAQQGKAKGHPDDMSLWQDGQVDAAREWTEEYALFRHQKTVEAELERTGETWARACAKLKLPANTPSVSATQKQLWQLIELLRPLPDKKAA